MCQASSVTPAAASTQESGVANSRATYTALDVAAACHKNSWNVPELLKQSQDASLMVECGVETLPLSVVNEAIIALPDLPLEAVHLAVAISSRRRGAGRQAGTDPLMKPGITPAKAWRILYNRQTAADSKARKKIKELAAVVKRNAKTRRPGKAGFTPLLLVSAGATAAAMAGGLPFWQGNFSQLCGPVWDTDMSPTAAAAVSAVPASSGSWSPAAAATPAAAKFWSSDGPCRPGAAVAAAAVKDDPRIEQHIWQTLFEMLGQQQQQPAQQASSLLAPGWAPQAAAPSCSIGCTSATSTGLQAAGRSILPGVSTHAAAGTAGGAAGAGDHVLAPEVAWTGAADALVAGATTAAPVRGGCVVQQQLQVPPVHHPKELNWYDDDVIDMITR